MRLMGVFAVALGNDERGSGSHVTETQDSVAHRAHCRTQRRRCWWGWAPHSVLDEQELRLGCSFGRCPVHELADRAGQLPARPPGGVCFDRIAELIRSEREAELNKRVPQVMYPARNPDFWVYRAYIKSWQAIQHGPSDSHTHQHV